MSEEGIFVALLIDGHTPELIDVEGLYTLPDALLLEYGGSSVFQFPSQIADEQEGGEDDQADDSHQ